MPRSARPPTPWRTSVDVHVILYVVPVFSVTVFGEKSHWLARIATGTAAEPVGVGVGVAAAPATATLFVAAEAPASFETKCAATNVPAAAYVCVAVPPVTAVPPSPKDQYEEVGAFE